MLYLAQLVGFLITSLMTPGINAQKTCSIGSFGENCMYRCHCLPNVTCTESGKCPKDKCEGSYFGPGCQFHDYVIADADDTTESFIRDNEIATCNSRTTATFVEVKLIKPHQFLWFRIEVKEQNYLLSFTTTINANDYCPNEIRYPGTNFVDVWCDTTVGLLTLRITGQIVPDVCSVRISAGRNVALGQFATQSSTTATSQLSGQAHHAVDGNTDSNFNNGSCTSTISEVGPWWSLAFNRPQILNTIYLYNRADYGDRIRGFTVRGFSTTGEKRFEFYDSSTSFQSVYEIPWTTHLPISQLQIVGLQYDPTDQRILTICEVIAHGETVCPEGMYGLWCGKKCQCKPNELCNPVNGLCDPGCKKGFHGLNCSLPCRSTCLDGLCRRLDGKCLECPFGYIGNFCEDDCSLKGNGPDCSSNCSAFCAKMAEEPIYERFWMGFLLVPVLLVAVLVTLYVCKKDVPPPPPEPVPPSLLCWGAPDTTAN